VLTYATNIKYKRGDRKMMERLLARMEAKMDSNQKKAEADRDELKAFMNAFQE
jgi:hypothetical protein